MLHHATQHVRHDILLCLLYKPSFGCQNLSLYPEFKLIKGLRKAKKETPTSSRASQQRLRQASSKQRLRNKLQNSHEMGFSLVVVPSGDPVAMRFLHAPKSMDTPGDSHVSRLLSRTKPLSFLLKAQLSKFFDDLPLIGHISSPCYDCRTEGKRGN